MKMDRQEGLIRLMDKWLAEPLDDSRLPIYEPERIQLRQMSEEPMKMTEDEAKTKWCPFTRYLATFRSEGKLEAAGCYNRGGADSGLENARCLGSGCMAWRWDFLRAFKSSDCDPDDPVIWTADKGKYSKTDGHCGLAG